jgi:hypothetical protein
MNDCGAKSKLSAPLIDLSKTGNYRLESLLAEFESKVSSCCKSSGDELDNSRSA